MRSAGSLQECYQRSFIMPIWPFGGVLDESRKLLELWKAGSNSNKPVVKVRYGHVAESGSKWAAFKRLGKNFRI